MNDLKKYKGQNVSDTFLIDVSKNKNTDIFINGLKFTTTEEVIKFRDKHKIKKLELVDVAFYNDRNKVYFAIIE